MHRISGYISSSAIGRRSHGPFVGNIERMGAKFTHTFLIVYGEIQSDRRLIRHTQSRPHLGGLKLEPHFDVFLYGLLRWRTLLSFINAFFKDYLRSTFLLSLFFLDTLSSTTDVYCRAFSRIHYLFETSLLTEVSASVHQPGFPYALQSSTKRQYSSFIVHRAHNHQNIHPLNGPVKINLLLSPLTTLRLPRLRRGKR